MKNKFDWFDAYMIIMVIAQISIIVVTGYKINYKYTLESEKYIILSEILDKKVETSTTYVRSGDVYLPLNDETYYFIMDIGEDIRVSKYIYYKYNIGDEVCINKIEKYENDNGNKVLVDIEYEWNGKE